MILDKVVYKTIELEAPVSHVWEVLTNPRLISRWLSDAEVEMVTDWTVGSPIVFEGVWHNIRFRDKGNVLQFEPNKILRYNYWSRLLRLPDNPANYSIIEFVLNGSDSTTTLVLTHSNFIIEAAYGHSNYYWTHTLERFKKVVESQIIPNSNF